MDYRQFLHELFDTKPDDLYLNIWTLPHKLSHFFKDVEKAADYVATIVNKPIDIYVACGLTEKMPRNRRGNQKSILAIPGFYMDMDFRSAEKPLYPPDIEAVLKIVKRRGFDPSLIILTGHGCHVWWLFKEVWKFKDENDRLFAKDLSKRLQLTIKFFADEEKYKLDSTQDLSRVLRLPQTFNNKDKKNPIETSLYEDSAIRYSDPAQFDSLLIRPEPGTEPIEIDENELKVLKKSLAIDPNAKPDPDMFQQLCEIDPKFQATWDQKRSDLNDTSPSGYALSIANAAAMVGWSDKETASLIIEFYNKHGHDIKKLHPAKLATTIQKAKDFVKEKKILDYMENVAPTQGTEYEKIVDPDGTKAKDATCAMLGFRIIKLIQYRQENTSAYQMILRDIDENTKENKYLYFKTPADLTEYRRFRLIVYERIRIRLRLNAKQWEQCVSNFALFITEVKSGSQTIKERMIIWLEMYLQEKRPIDIIESLNDNEPFVYQGNWWIYAAKFRNWINQYFGESKTIESSELDLKIIKAQHKEFTRTRITDNVRKTIRPWKIPLTIITPPPKKDDKVVVLDFPAVKEG